MGNLAKLRLLGCTKMSRVASFADLFATPPERRVCVLCASDLFLSLRGNDDKCASYIENVYV